jgi:hypothetical protein
MILFSSDYIRLILVGFIRFLNWKTLLVLQVTGLSVVIFNWVAQDKDAKGFSFFLGMVSKLNLMHKTWSFFGADKDWSIYSSWLLFLDVKNTLRWKIRSGRAARYMSSLLSVSLLQNPLFINLPTVSFFHLGWRTSDWLCQILHRSQIVCYLLWEYSVLKWSEVWISVGPLNLSYQPEMVPKGEQDPLYNCLYFRWVSTKTHSWSHLCCCWSAQTPAKSSWNSW